MEFSDKFKLKNISNICLDCTFFIFYLEKMGLKESSLLKIDANEINNTKIKEKCFNKTNAKENLLKFFNENLTVSLIFLFSILFLAFLNNFRNFLKELFISFSLKLDEYFIDKNNENSYLRELLDFYNVKNCLIFKENSLLKEKYGKNFNPDLISESDLLEEFKYFLEISEDLKIVVIEAKSNIAEMKFSTMENMILFICYISLLISYCYLNFQIFYSIGCMIFLINLISIFGISAFYYMKKSDF